MNKSQDEPQGDENTPEEPPEPAESGSAGKKDTLPFTPDEGDDSPVGSTDQHSDA